MKVSIFKLGNLLRESKILSTKPNSNRRITVRLNVQGVEKRSEKNDSVGATRYFVRKAKQFIYGKQNLFKGAFGIIPDEFDGYESSMDLPAFDISDECLPEWIFYFFKQGNFYQTLEKYAQGSGSRRIYPETLYNLEIPLPNIKIQKKVIERLKHIESIILNSKSEIDRIGEDNTLIKQSILQDAVQGKLVPQDPNDEPAEKLFEKITIYKDMLIKEGKIRKEKSLSPVTKENIPFQIPEGWKWCRLGNIVTIKGGKRLPNGDNFTNYPTNHIYIRVTDMKNGTVDYSDLHYISDETYEKIQQYIVEQDDLYLTIVGATIGKVGIIPEKCQGMNLTENAARIIVYESQPKFIYNFIKSSYIQNQFFFKTLQVGVPKLALHRVANTFFPLPPLSEQKRIVEKVETLMKICDEQEKNIIEAKENINKLNQAILSEAFKEG